MKLQDNSYVREYYDRQVGPLSSYTEDRWFSSVVGLFDYRQTQRALAKALQNVQVAHALEIGPGDAVWTSIIKAHVQGGLHLVEQSKEMLIRAREVLKDFQDITYEHSDFMEASPPSQVELIVAMRCFEYFTNKPQALRKMFSLLTIDGVLILVTKNADMYTTTSAQKKTLHTAQVTKREMVSLLKEVGFVVESIFPAVMRWKANNVLMRMVFTVLHYVSVKTSGRVHIPILERYATESYVYVARKTK